MAAACLQFMSYSTLLLLGVFLHDAEASTCDRIVHKKVGDTVVLPSCLNEPVEEVTLAMWTYKERTVAKKGQNVTQLQFMGRTDLNPKDFSLTVRKLTRQDSGDFKFLSEVNRTQRPTVTITLQVHEPITKQPDLMINSTWVASNGSCTVFLECSSVSDIGVTYTLAVRNQTQSGSKLQYNFSPEEGETTFTCTVSNTVSGMSASKTVKCSNGTSQPQEIGSHLVSWIVRLVIGIVVISLLLLLLLYYKSKVVCCNRLGQSQTVKQDDSQQQVYSTLLHGDGCVYETIRGSEDAGKDAPPNVYDNVPSPTHLRDPGKQSS